MSTVGVLLFLAVAPQVAVRASGDRLECVEEPRPGARTVRTAVGTWEDVADPVVRVEAAAVQRRHLQSLEALRELDPTAWLKRLAERGYLNALIAAEPEAGELRALWLDLLADIGREIDPLPHDLPRAERVEELWRRLREEDDAARRALLCGRLETEIGEASAGDPSRRVSLADLRRALRDRDPLLRWAAARIGAHERERALANVLLDHSLADDAAEARLASAEALHALDGEVALGHWLLALWRERAASRRVHAAEHLGRYGEDRTDVVDALVLTLSAANRPEPGAYVFFGRQVSVVMDFDVQVGLASAIAEPTVGVVTEGALLAVRILGVREVRAVHASLVRLTGHDFGGDAEAWAAWLRSREEAAARRR